MLIHSITIFLIAGLLLVSPRVMAANPVSAADVHPEFVSPYEPYELKLQSFFPVPSRLTGVLLHVRINGRRPLRLVLDSGAESVVIDARTAHSLGVSSGTAIGLVGLRTTSARTASVESVDVGPLSFRNSRIDLVDGGVVEGADVVIPVSMFSNFLVRLDLPERTLGLVPHPDEHRPAIVEGDLLLVRTPLNQMHDGYIVLDTGSSVMRSPASWQGPRYGYTMSCGKEHQKRRVKLLAKFGNAEPGTIVEAELRPECGVKVTSKRLGYNDYGWYMIPSKLGEVLEDL